MVGEPVTGDERQPDQQPDQQADQQPDQQQYVVGVEMSRRFVEAYRADKGSLHAYLLYLGADPETAQDVLGEAMVHVWARLQSGAVPDDLGPYLRRAVRNTFYDHCRKARHRREVPYGDALLDLDDPAADAIDQWMEVERVRRAMARLPRHYRRVLELSVHGRGLGWVATELGLPTPNAAAVALHRARRALRRELLAGEQVTCRGQSRPRRRERHPRSTRTSSFS